MDRIPRATSFARLLVHVSIEDGRDWNYSMEASQETLPAILPSASGRFPSAGQRCRNNVNDIVPPTRLNGRS